jgi:glyoxylase-like metal-dependent hydrolase (beta-lactamase superfamily II)
LDTAQFGPGESQTATAYYNAESGELYAGDLTDNEATPALLEGHTCGWLTNLDQLQQRFPDAETVYPGHGAPAAAGPQIDAQRAYLQRVRSLVRAATDATTAKGRQVSAAEQASIVRTLEQDFPNYPSVASLPNLLAVNVKAVVTEISAERAATLPAACR